MNKKPFCILLFLLFGLPSLAQDLQVQPLTVADGLSQGFITSIFEDSRGFIWIGTLQGLNRYDGYQVKRFVQDNSNQWSLNAQFIHCITEDKNGLLWIGTDKGPVIMDSYTERFVLLSEIISDLPKQPIITIAEQGNRMWLVCEKNPDVVLYSVQPPEQLVKMIREDQISVIDLKMQLPELKLEPGLFWQPELFHFSDSIFMGFDQQDRLYRIDPSTLQVLETNPRSMDFEQFSPQGYFYPLQKTRGLILYFPVDKIKIPNPSWHWGRHLQLPNKKRVLFRTADTNVYKLQTRLKASNLDSTSSSLEPLIQLDKGCSFAGIVDRTGNIWLGTTGYGVRKISQPLLKYRQIIPEKSIYNFVQLPDGRIWTGIFQSDRVFNPRKGQLEPAPWATSPTRTWAYSLFISKNASWWMANRIKNQLFLVKRAPGSDIWEKLPVHLNLLNDIPVLFLEDKRGYIWMAGNSGQILRIHPESNQIEEWDINIYFPRAITAPMRSNHIIETADSCLWLATSFGLVQIKDYSRGQPTFKTYFNKKNAPITFSHEHLLSIYIDPDVKHILWLGTRGGGLNRFDSKTGTTTIYTEKDGLPDNVVYGILPDSSGRLWLSTNRGLSVFDPRTQQFLNISGPGSPLNTEFNTGAFCRLPTGELAFGSTQGLFILKPETLKKISFSGTIAITKFKINGLELELSTTDSRLSLNPENVYALDLPYDQNNLGLEFAALHTSNPASVHYRYRLKGLQENWMEIASQRSINLAAIPPGQYILELQCTVPDVGWDAAAHSARVKLTIHPPWYLSWPACLAYLLLIIALFRFLLHYYRRRLQLQHVVALGEKEMERLKSLDDFKTRFFSYIAHEFKTPLTLILGMARRLERDSSSIQKTDYAEKIVAQGQNMLELVDQILDISKLNNQGIQLKMQLGNISDYMRYLVESLRPLAEFQHIKIGFETTAPKLQMDFDPSRLKHIVHNLIGNAIRHTPEGGTIGVTVNLIAPEQVQISVSDTGRGIQTYDLPHIFDRYYRGNSGRQEQYHFGLGLAFVKDMVELLGGSIDVNSQAGKGAAFHILLPVSQQAPKQKLLLGNKPDKPAQKRKEKYKRPNLPSLLIVEDNPAISEYLDLCLSTNFLLHFTNNGEQGLGFALENIPDLILTDIMMPGMDGLELTRQLKSHDLTSHIPIVMLSAKSDVADRLTGQSLGANAYLGKPFDETELLLILKNLYQLQQQWRKHNAMIVDSADPVGQLEEEKKARYSTNSDQMADDFLLKIYALFEKNYSDDSYDLPQLCRELNMSKSQLQRKLSVISDQSAMVMLRQFRLQKSFDLLKHNPQRNVKEVCFQVGFKDPAHFSRLFSQTFQRNPSSFKD